ncbi:hypothetical protein Q8F55_008499 [Vanrija albida]|uniref:F-box domain-containing protein n=1 Tax=Vanrija albida TaxID=181172 RepID=A0ABR3PQZ9_9TREE
MPRLLDLPAELLIHISDSLPSRDVGRLRLTCTAVDTALAHTTRLTFGTVSLVATQAGLDTLAAIAASPVAPYVKQVVVGRQLIFVGTRGVSPARAEQFNLLGLRDPRGPHRHPKSSISEVFPLPGADTPFARQLGAALTALPCLQEASVGLGYLQMTRFADRMHFRPLLNRTAPVWFPFGLRELLSNRERQARGGGYVSDVYDPQIVNAVFRDLVFALAHAHAAGTTTATILYEHAGLDDTTFALTVAEKELVAPFLTTLKHMYLSLRGNFWYEPEGPWDSPSLDSFLELCGSLVELSLWHCGDSSGTNPLQRLTADPPPLPHLKVLLLGNYSNVSPEVLIKLLSQWNLHEVDLRGITLRQETSLACDKSSTGIPMAWDAVLRAVSQHGAAGTMEWLRLDKLAQVHSIGNNGDSDSDGPTRYTVKFECADMPDGAPTAIVFASTRTVVFPGSGDDWEDVVVADGVKGDVFLRAASLLKEPAVLVSSNSDSSSDWDDEEYLDFDDSDLGDEDLVVYHEHLDFHDEDDEDE